MKNPFEINSEGFFVVNSPIKHFKLYSKNLYHLIFYDFYEVQKFKVSCFPIISSSNSKLDREIPKSLTPFSTGWICSNKLKEILSKNALFIMGDRVDLLLVIC